ncbi:MAG: enoyl-CoA hydratase-related protein [Rhodococcus sp. (in: high G+C Gram-positive bacteria)]
MTSHLRLEFDSGIATLTIDRPHKRNAMTLEMWSEFPDLAARVDASPEAKVLVIRGGEHFSAGADINEFATVRTGPEGGQRYNAVVDRAEEAITRLSKPTIAAVTGYCIGGGCELAVACDIRIGTPETVMAITPAKLGLVYTYHSTRALIRLVGPSWAKQMLYTGDPVSAGQAERIGLLNEVVAVEALDRRIAELASTICSRAQTTVHSTKVIIEKILADSGEDQAVADLYAHGYTSADYAEGVAAFVAKRQPQFR